MSCAETSVEFSLQVSNIHKEHAKRETILTSKHTEELRRTELHAEAELREVYHPLNILLYTATLSSWYHLS